MRPTAKYLDSGWANTRADTAAAGIMAKLEVKLTPMRFSA